MNEPQMPEEARENKRKYIYFVTEEVAEMISRDKKRLTEEGYPADEINYEIYVRYSSYCKNPPYLNPLEAPGMSEWDLASLLVDGLVEPSIYDAGRKAARREYASWSRCSDSFLKVLIPILIGESIGMGFFCLFSWWFYGSDSGFNAAPYLVFGIVLLAIPFITYLVAWLGGMLWSKRKADAIMEEIQNNLKLFEEFSQRLNLIDEAHNSKDISSIEAISNLLALPPPKEIFGRSMWRRWFTRFYWYYGYFYKSTVNLIVLSIYVEHHLDKAFSPIVSDAPFLRGYTSDYHHLRVLGKYPWIELPAFIVGYNTGLSKDGTAVTNKSNSPAMYLRHAESSRLSYIFNSEKHKRLRRLSYSVQDDLLRYYGKDESARQGYLVVEINRSVFPTTHLYTKEDKYVVRAINVGLWNRAENPSLVKSWEYDFTEEEYLDMPFDIGDVFVPTEFYRGKDARYHGNDFKKYKVVHANYEDFAKFRAQNT